MVMAEKYLPFIDSSTTGPFAIMGDTMRDIWRVEKKSITP
jgi:hypothetical protein